ncbi:uncharacterized protein LOC132755290 isoform X2 [Ruditapes philippinarum]|uniref:uncharacterized protein LOC132755290 isoform X2 n=1 Tax=Ruditapes philippinarum TaxID=129788 RepID=UPI00295B4281|nr:uncharacterized protein LOC132755290 isoform X2 [Ruditapes philippinarum]
MDTRNIIAALIWAIVCAGSSYGHITDFEHTHSQFEVGQADANMSTSTTTEPKTAKPLSTDNVPDPACATGLICIQELLKVKRTQRLTIQDSNSPWLNLPNYKVICDKDNFRYIGCVRSNLRQCQSPLTKRYGDDFTNEDAEDIKGLYDFSKEHCNTINNEDFTAKYRCIEEKSTSNQFRQCVREADNLPSSKQICRIRDCVADNIEDKCNTDSSLLSLYIDAVNIYRRDSVRLLNKQCSSSSATDIGLSIAAIIISIFIVVVV